MKRLAFLAALAIALVLAPAAAADGPKDQIVISGDVSVPAGKTVGDVVVIDGAVDVAGRVDGDIVAVSGPVRVSGAVNGDVSAVSDRIVLLPGARVDGDVRYGDEQPAVSPRAVVGGEVTDEGWSDIAGFPWGAVGAVAWWIAATLSTLVLGIVFVLLAPRAVDRAYEAASRSVGPVIGWGALIFVGLPVLAVIALATLVGIPLGIGLLLALLPLGALAYVTSAFLLGRRLVKARVSRVVAFLAGWGVLRVLAIIPVVSTLVWLAAVVLGLGALAVALWRARDTGQPVPAGPEYPAGGVPA